MHGLIARRCLGSCLYKRWRAAEAAPAPTSGRRQLLAGSSDPHSYWPRPLPIKALLHAHHAAKQRLAPATRRGLTLHARSSPPCTVKSAWYCACSASLLCMPPCFQVLPCATRSLDPGFSRTCGAAVLKWRQPARLSAHPPHKLADIRSQTCYLTSHLIWSWSSRQQHRQVGHKYRAVNCTLCGNCAEEFAVSVQQRIHFQRVETCT